MPIGCHQVGDTPEYDGGYLTFTFTGAEDIEVAHNLKGTPVFFLACFYENAAGAFLTLNTADTTDEVLVITSSGACVVRVIPMLK